MCQTPVYPTWRSGRGSVIPLTPTLPLSPGRWRRRGLPSLASWLQHHIEVSGLPICNGSIKFFHGSESTRRFHQSQRRADIPTYPQKKFRSARAIPFIKRRGNIICAQGTRHLATKNISHTKKFVLKINQEKYYTVDKEVQLQ